MSGEALRSMEGCVVNYKAKLVLMIAELFKRARIAPGEVPDVASGEIWDISLPRYAYKYVLALLIPVESAMRRLIVMGAFGTSFVLDPLKAGSRQTHERKEAVAAEGADDAPDSMTDAADASASASAHCTSSAAPRPPVFDMFDPVKTFTYRSFDTIEEFDLWKAQKDANPLVIPPADPRKRMDAVKALSLWRRIQGLHHAMEHFDAYVSRYARWRGRRKAELAAGRALKGRYGKSLMRRSRPPGFVEKHGDEIHYLLRDVHTLAYDSELPKWENSS
jgi:hypothetical protein